MAFNVRLRTLALLVLATSAATTTSPVLAAETGDTGRWTISGDLRLRYEYNSDDGDEPSWDRATLRARLAANYAISDEWTLGGRISTGDPDNPRTADVGGDHDPFGLDDFDVRLDRAFLAFRGERLFLTGGRFAHPLTSNEMVWDPDASPQGLGGSYQMIRGERGSAKVTGLFFPIDSDIYRGGSDLLAGQMTFGANPRENWGVSLDASYYDFEIEGLNPTSPGGARGNNLQPGTLTYLSDFDLLDTIVTVNYSGFGDRWPVKVQADYVKNLGAAVDEDDGFALDVYVGTIKSPGRLSFRYTYSQVEQDAVLGVFSNDTIVYATNYELHELIVEFPLWGPTSLTLSTFLYRRLDPALVPGSDDDWVSRNRIMFHASF